MISLARKLAYQFQSHHGGDVEEWESDALFTLLTEPQETETLNRQRVWKRLRIARETQTRHQRTLRRFYRPNTVYRDPDSLQRFLGEVSEDARKMVRLVLNTFPLGNEMSQGHRRDSRWKITRTLLDWGWTTERITSTFQEIREALNIP